MGEQREMPDPTEDRASRAVLLALLEGALDRDEHAEVERLRRELRELGVDVHLAVTRPRRRRRGRKGGAS